MPRKKGVPYARTDQLKERRSFSLTLIAYEGLKRVAQRIGMPASTLLEAIGRGELYVSTKPQTFDQALAAWDLEELAADALIPYERLLEIVENKKEPLTDELIRLAASLRLEPSGLRNLIKNRNGEPQTNGH